MAPLRNALIYCDSCGDGTLAACRVMLADLDGTVADTTYLCMDCAGVLRIRDYLDTELIKHPEWRTRRPKRFGG